MVTEEQKYKAETLKIVGIAMLTPIGPLFLTPFVLFNQLGLLGITIYIGVSFISFLGGVTMIEMGRNHLNERNY